MDLARENSQSKLCGPLYTEQARGNKTARKKHFELNGQCGNSPFERFLLFHEETVMFGMQGGAEADRMFAWSWVGMHSGGSVCIHLIASIILRCNISLYR